MYQLLKFVYFYSLIYYRSTTDLLPRQFTTELNADPEHQVDEEPLTLGEHFVTGSCLVWVDSLLKLKTTTE